MYRKIIFIILVMVLIVGVILLNKDNTIKNNTVKVSEFDGVSIEIKEGTLSKTGATIIITDLSGNQNYYGEWYQIDIKVNNKWKKLISNDTWYNLMALTVGEDNIIEFEINWENTYGKLEKGKYRLIKEINNDYIGVEFEI